MNLLQLTVTTGCSNVLDENKKRTIRIVNLVCLTTALMSIVFGLGCYFLMGGALIYLPAILETILLLSMIYVNKEGWFTAASMGTILINNLTIQYYSAVLGRVTEVYLLFIFLVGLSMLIFDNKRLRIISIGLTIACFLAGEINIYNGYVPKLLITGDHNLTAQFVIRWVTIPGILGLDLMVIYYYMKNIDRLRKNALEHVENKLRLAKEYNAELLNLVAQLEKATDAKSIFVRETSHEIRTPLNAIFGISQLLQLKVEQNKSLAPIRFLADHLYAASYNTKEIINNILEFSKIEAGKQDKAQPAVFNIRDWIADTVNMHQYVAIIKNVKIKFSVDDEMPEQLNADKILLSKTLNNLLSNAIKFTTQDSHVTLRIFSSNKKWYIQVTDQGAGIPEDRLRTIFDAFVTERNIFLEGTGLGLHITQKLVECLQGRIEVSSILGKGTTFTVILPLIKAGKSTDTDPDNRPEQLVNLNDTTILIIEDDKMCQLVLSRFLCGLGSRVMLAEDGLEGLLLAKASRPDVIILDSHIPGMSGKETLACIREDTLLKNIPVIIASGDPFKEASDELLKAGANEYMLKPIEFKTLHTTLSKYIKQRITHP
ncbi:Signal transduction histidine kinase [Chitinophaga sp. YR573]|uniref:ATP-binding protein n=1 Tax=Chitinophaga sp. YR573 TaxID=1881040 RepID=UPI0008D5FD20|nr:ATP-binding protein [Chitinophaga sp. YR573]SEW46724.1 Signal transduction histidine kinase [Chitinophaga sp. YR573]